MAILRSVSLSLALSSVMACTTNVTNVIVVADGGTPAAPSHDAGSSPGAFDGGPPASLSSDAGHDAGRDAGPRDSGSPPPAGDAAPTCQSDEPAGTANDCYSNETTDYCTAFTGCGWHEYTCEDGGAPPLAGCKSLGNGMHCCTAACVRFAPSDSFCDAQHPHAYSCAAGAPTPSGCVQDTLAAPYWCCP